MHRHRLVVLCVLLLCSPLAAAESQSLTSRLDAVLAQRIFRDAKVGALVVRADSGETIYARTPNALLTPASNQKILTAVAALATFGPAHRFVTRIYADAAPDQDGAVQTLTVRGGGDPALTSEDWWRIAADLKRSGLRRVRGDLVLDDSLFDDERWNPAWGPVASRAYHSPISALSANYGAFAIEIGPGDAQGATVRATVDPAVSWLRLRNRARTGLSGKRSTLQLGCKSAGGFEEVDVGGVVPAGSEPRTYYRSVSDPTRYAGEVLRMQLEANGIVVGGAIRTGQPPSDARELLAFQGKPLGEIVRLFMKYSNNGIAESLVKAMGAEATGGQGTWANGVVALRSQLTKLGLDLAGSNVIDGSGLSRDNRVSARVFVDALRLARGSFDFGPEFVSSLPIAARDGTLAHRAGRSAGEVRAKTGLLNHVTGLSGYVRTRAGEELAFSILLNGYKRGDAEAMAGLDAFAAALASWDGAGD